MQVTSDSSGDNPDQSGGTSSLDGGTIDGGSSSKRTADTGDQTPPLISEDAGGDTNRTPPLVSEDAVVTQVMVRPMPLRASPIRWTVGS
ncbi:MAG: hypothetical protein JXA30_14730 [Deltaproteobacteria bacterium]|nr:hypothetical protein [Deltaproteobacteria bacterium]